jgi:hypothetical protein
MPDTDPRDAQWFLRRMPHPDVLKSVLTDDPVDRLLATTRARAIVLGGDDLMPKASAEEQQVAAMLHTATEAAKRLASDPETPLGDEEKAALDLFTLLLSRPAMLVKGGRVREDPENWPEVFEQGDLINPVIAGVGRIEFADKFKVGTGFIVGDKRVLTNNHVVCGLFGLDLSAWRYTRQDFEETMKAYNESWSAHPDTRPRFEMVGEFGSDTTNAVRINRVLGSHQQVDMAVLELDAVPDKARRVTLATEEPATFSGHRVYAVGYPVVDSRLKPAPLPILRRVFGQDETLGMKRLSPGTIMEWEKEHQFHHDASTLRGSSGSCIVDFDTHRVVGLHFSGSYDEHNNAVPLWKFRDDVLLTANGVLFGEE